MVIVDLSSNLAFRMRLSTACGLLSVALLIPVLAPCKVIADATNEPIVWANLDSTYTDYSLIKPKLEIKEVDFVLWKMLPLYFLLYRYDEKRKNWIEGNSALDDTVGMIVGSIIARKGEVIDKGFYAGQFFKCTGTKCSFLSQGNIKYPVNGKYRITFFYGTDLKNFDRLDKFSHSPEFMIDGHR